MLDTDYCSTTLLGQTSRDPFLGGFDSRWKETIPSLSPQEKKPRRGVSYVAATRDVPLGIWLPPLSLEFFCPFLGLGVGRRAACPHEKEGVAADGMCHYTWMGCAIM